MTQIVSRTLLAGLAFSGAWLYVSYERPLPAGAIDSSPRAMHEAQLRGTKNLLKEGHAADTIAQAQELLVELKKVKWDINRVDYRLLRVPDQDFAEWKAERLPGIETFKARNLNPIYADIAFVSDLYVHTDRKIVRGIEAKVEKTGFLIVGWKSGYVEQVPYSSVRFLPKPGEPGVWLRVWPGMSTYRSDLPTEQTLGTADTATPPPSE